MAMKNDIFNMQKQVVTVRITLSKLSKRVKLGPVLIFYSANLNLSQVTKLRKGQVVSCFGLSHR